MNSVRNSVNPTDCDDGVTVEAARDSASGPPPPEAHEGPEMGGRKIRSVHVTPPPVATVQPESAASHTARVPEPTVVGALTASQPFVGSPSASA